MDTSRHEVRQRSGLVGVSRSEDGDLEVSAFQLAVARRAKPMA
jgi:hypothetical protein